MTCTFFGHRDAPQEIEGILRQVLVALIEARQADTFYVGNQGKFDRMVVRVLSGLQLEYPHITYAVVLAYLPGKQEPAAGHNTLYPGGLEGAPPRFAIARRNAWMLQQADWVIVYVSRSVGNAASLQARAERSGKAVINLWELGEPEGAGRGK